MIVKTSFFNKWTFWLYIVTIFFMVSIPTGSALKLDDITIITLRGDYFFHILAFIPWAFFHSVSRQKMGIWLILGLLFASGSEGLQYLLPYRAFNINDLVANVCGIVLGFPLAWFFLKRSMYLPFLQQIKNLRPD